MASRIFISQTLNFIVLSDQDVSKLSIYCFANTNYICLLMVSDFKNVELKQLIIVHSLFYTRMTLVFPKTYQSSYVGKSGEARCWQRSQPGG